MYFFDISSCQKSPNRPKSFWQNKTPLYPTFSTSIFHRNSCKRGKYSASQLSRMGLLSVAQLCDFVCQEVTVSQHNPASSSCLKDTRLINYRVSFCLTLPPQHFPCWFFCDVNIQRISAFTCFLIVNIFRTLHLFVGLWQTRRQVCAFLNPISLSFHRWTLIKRKGSHSGVTAKGKGRVYSFVTQGFS